MPYLDSLDLANRALQHCGATQILAVGEDSKSNKEAAFAYDKVRRAELQRNTWRFAIRRAALRPVDTDTMILNPAAFDSTKTYLPGAVVQDTNGLLWISMKPGNVNNAPGSTDAWDMYFGPMTVHAYDSTETYFSGDLVYKPGAIAGSYAVYLSLQNGNSAAPDTATPYDATVTYHKGMVVSSGGSNWRSLIEVNLGITPADGPPAYDNTAIYAAAGTVTASDHFIYSSIAGSNVGNDPVTDGGIHWTNTNVANAWSRSPTITTRAISWQLLDATIDNLLFSYPIGAGPCSQSTTRNVYRLPSGYLREAPQDPKAGSVSYLGAPSGRQYDDWEFEGNYIVSSDVQPILFRFVADVTRVADMPDMFCEGFACSLATAICEPITQSAEKLQTIASEYKLRMSEARTRNAIETGPVEPPDDDYLTCRG